MRRVKWIEPAQLLCEKLRIVVKWSLSFWAFSSTSNKILLTIAKVFNLIYWAKKMPANNDPYTTDDNQSSKNCLLKILQYSFFHSAVHSWQSGIKLVSNWKIQCFNSLFDQKGLLRSCSRLHYAPTQWDLEKQSNHFARHGQNCTFVFGTCVTNMFSTVRRTIKRLHSTTFLCDWLSQSISKHTISLFLKSRLWHKKHLISFSTLTQFSLSNSRIRVPFFS